MVVYYDEVTGGISAFRDDIADPLYLAAPDNFGIICRDRLENPIIISDDEDTVVFRRRYAGHDLYRCDYQYKRNGKHYLLPEEIGQISEEICGNTTPNRHDHEVIAFSKGLMLDDLWLIQ